MNECRPRFFCSDRPSLPSGIRSSDGRATRPQHRQTTCSPWDRRFRRVEWTGHPPSIRPPHWGASTDRWGASTDRWGASADRWGASADRRRCTPNQTGHYSVRQLTHDHKHLGSLELCAGCSTLVLSSGRDSSTRQMAHGYKFPAKLGGRAAHEYQACTEPASRCALHQSLCLGTGCLAYGP